MIVPNCKMNSMPLQTEFILSDDHVTIWQDLRGAGKTAACFMAALRNSNRREWNAYLIFDTFTTLNWHKHNTLDAVLDDDADLQNRLSWSPNRRVLHIPSREYPLSRSSIAFDYVREDFTKNLSIFKPDVVIFDVQSWTPTHGSLFSFVEQRTPQVKITTRTPLLHNGARYIKSQ